MTFKFRSECKEDAQKVWAICASKAGECCGMRISQIDVALPDCEVRLQTTTIGLGELRNIMRSIPDTHVMIQTLRLAENYTGERDYNKA